MSAPVIWPSGLFEARLPYPYYIPTPDYHDGDPISVVLHLLCHALNRRGEEAYIILNRRPDSPYAALSHGLRTPVLTDVVAEEHHKFGRTPVVVRAASAEQPASNAIEISYVFPLAADSYAPPEARHADLSVAYCAGRSRVRESPLTLFIPPYDPTAWEPCSTASREGACVIERGRARRLPADADSAEAGPPQVAGPLSAASTAELFASSTHAYAEADDPLIIAARLSGCPVVVRRPDRLRTIAVAELGSGGLAPSDGAQALAKARAELPGFRDAYNNALMAIEPALSQFVQRTQALASARLYTNRVKLHAL